MPPWPMTERIVYEPMRAGCPAGAAGWWCPARVAVGALGLTFEGGGVGMGGFCQLIRDQCERSRASGTRTDRNRKRSDGVGWATVDMSTRDPVRKDYFFS